MSEHKSKILNSLHYGKICLLLDENIDTFSHPIYKHSLLCKVYNFRNNRTSKAYTGYSNVNGFYLDILHQFSKIPNN